MRWTDDRPEQPALALLVPHSQDSSLIDAVFWEAHTSAVIRSTIRKAIMSERISDEQAKPRRQTSLRDDGPYAGHAARGRRMSSRRTLVGATWTARWVPRRAYCAAAGGVRAGWARPRR